MNDAGGGVTAPELTEEADRLVGLAEERGLHLRLLGGLAVCELCPSAQLPALRRHYPDIDFVTDQLSGAATRSLLSENDYEGDQRFNALHGETRLLFFHRSGAWQVDVFLGEFSMCHKIDLSRSLLPGRRTIPPSDLLLTKLQIVEMNLKDMKDVVAILLDHPVTANSDPEAIELGRFTAATSKDWGLYTTVTGTLTRVRADAAHLLDTDQLARVEERITAIAEAMLSAPKSRKWKLRSRIGRRVLWYELPDEVGR
jgi:hypothetical protein